MKVSEVKYTTPIEKDIEKAIEDRLFNGFNTGSAAMTAGSSGAIPFMSPMPTITFRCTGPSSG